MLRLRSLPGLQSGPLAVVLLGLLPVIAVAQSTRWVIDPRTSLAWWQVNPNLNHLWATTCTGDPGWRPGEGRSSGWNIDPKLKLSSHGYANDDDTVHVPLFPRKNVQPICAEAVRGDVEVADRAHWRGVHGTIAVRGDALFTGEAMRDVMMHQSLNTDQFPEMQFQLDSLVVTTTSADTVFGTAVGTMTIRGVPRPSAAAVKLFPDAGGMRVLARFRITAKALADYAPKLHDLGLGVNTRLWKDFFFGADLVFQQPQSTAAK